MIPGPLTTTLPPGSACLHESVSCTQTVTVLPLGETGGAVGTTVGTGAVVGTATGALVGWDAGVGWDDGVFVGDVCPGAAVGVVPGVAVRDVSVGVAPSATVGVVPAFTAVLLAGSCPLHALRSTTILIMVIVGATTLRQNPLPQPKILLLSRPIGQSNREDLLIVYHPYSPNTRLTIVKIYMGTTVSFAHTYIYIHLLIYNGQRYHS